MDTLTDRIDALLPQTQCTKCGYAGCRPYAQALADGAAELNRCPPGGAAGIQALATLLSRAALPLDPSCGVERAPRIARIDPAVCIGCTKCIAACPVDAIVGAAKRMHTVISAHCTGCDLCVPVCPVDCIGMRAPDGAGRWSAEDAAAARARHARRGARLARDRAVAPTVPAAAPRPHAPTGSAPGDDDAARSRRAVIEAAMRRARERLADAPRRGGSVPR